METLESRQDDRLSCCRLKRFQRHSPRSEKLNTCLAAARSRHSGIAAVVGFTLGFLCVIPPVTHSSPVGSSSNASELSDYPAGVNYLLRYAYLPQSDMETGALRSQEELRESVKAFQRFAHLPQTGEFDEETKRMMAKPRCGLPDIMSNTPAGAGRRIRRYVLGPSKWKKRHLTWRLENYSPRLDYGQSRLAITKAFQLWSDVTYLTFREVSRTSNADINIRFARGYHGDGYPFDGSGRVLAHAFYPGDDRGGDTHFDDEEPWTLYETDKGIDLYTVAAHEFGHALGLAHSYTLKALMYPIYQGYTPNFQLNRDDVSGIQALYGVKRPYVPRSSIRPPTANPTYRIPTTPRPRPTNPVTTTTAMAPTTTEPKWNIGDCNGNFDAISYIRGEYYMFKGNYFWRANKKGILRGFPLKISQFWYGFPHELKDNIHIDAVYERPIDNRILFFIGKNYYEFSNNHLTSRFPASGKPLTALGLPSDIEKVDAAFIWSHNKKTYFISKDMYWKYDEATKSIERDYPRPMKMWQGVQLPVTTALTEPNGKTYFVKGDMVYEFNNAFMKIADVAPQTASQRYLNCTLDATTAAPPTEAGISSQGRPRENQFLLSVLLYVVLLFNFC